MRKAIAFISVGLFFIFLIASVSGATSDVVVNIVSPNDGESFEVPATIFISADVELTNNVTEILGVEFMKEGFRLGVDYSEPYEFEWESDEVGSYEIIVNVVDVDRVRHASEPVNIELVEGPSPEVTVIIESPNDGETFTVPATVFILADVEVINNGTEISSVEFIVNSNLIGVDYSEPYEFEWESDEIGMHEIIVNAIDIEGGSHASEPVNIELVEAPSLLDLIINKLFSIDEKLDLILDNLNDWSVSECELEHINSEIEINGVNDFNFMILEDKEYGEFRVDRGIWEWEIGSHEETMEELEVLNGFNPGFNFGRVSTLYGVEITTKSNIIFVKGFSKSQIDGASRGELLNEDRDILGGCLFVTDYCEFSEKIRLDPNSKYYFVADGNGAMVNRYTDRAVNYPINSEFFDWTAGYKEGTLIYGDLPTVISITILPIITNPNENILPGQFQVNIN